MTDMRTAVFNGAAGGACDPDLCGAVVAGTLAGAESQRFVLECGALGALHRVKAAVSSQKGWIEDGKTPGWVLMSGGSGGGGGGDSFIRCGCSGVLSMMWSLSSFDMG